MTSRFSPSDRSLLLIVLAVIAVASTYVWFNYDAAFPQASLSLPLSRDEITRKAEDFLATRTLSTSGFRNLTLFDPDEDARLYLERELGLERANKLMQGEAPVWRWRARWFKPPEKEELIVHLRPDGRLIGFEHRVAETAAGARLDSAAARTIAEAFLKQQTTQPHKLIGEQRESRPNRDDHLFTWEQENFKAKDATLRRMVLVQGAKVGSYRESLYVPEQWQRDFATLRSANELYAGFAQGLYVILAIASVALLVLAIRRRSIQWKPLLYIAGIVAAVNFANQLNTLPFAIDGMQTSTPYPQMLLLGLLGAIGAAVGILVYVLLPAAAGAPLFSRIFPTLMPLEQAFRLPGLGTRSFFRAATAGFGFAGAHLAFLTAFYLIGAKLGVWSPAEVSYSDMLGTPIPWIYPVAIAMMAATSEEFWFRLLAIPLLARFVPMRSIAIVLPAFVWGFLHANYPQQPGWIRGVEVGLIGVAAGFLMLRFGIVATLVWHYVIDAFLIGMFLFQAQAISYRIQAVILALAILAPWIVSAVLYRRNGGFLAEPEHVPPADFEPPPVQEALAPALPAPWPLRRLLITAAIACAAAIALRPTIFGDFIQIKVSREQAIALANAEMQRRSLNPADWRTVADFAANLRLTDFEYLRQQSGPAQANALVRDRVAHAVWRVRYFKPLVPEEWIFYIRQDARVYRFDHVLDEKAKGAQPDRAEAEKLALAELARQGIEGYKLVDSQTDKYEHRTDHSFVWEDPEFRAGEARSRVALQMVGDEACEFRRFFKLPEQWLRDFQKPNLATYVQPAFFGSTAVPILLLLIRRISSAGQRFHWRVYAAVAGAALVLAIAGEINAWPQFFDGYNTATPLNSYLGQEAVSLFSRILLMAAAAFGLAFAVDCALQMIAPGRRLPAFSWQRALGSAVLIGSVFQLSEWILQQMPGPRARLPLFNIEGLDTVFPALGSLHDNLSAAFVLIGVGAVYAASALLLIPRRRIFTALALLLIVNALDRTLSPIQTPFALAASAILLGAIVLIVMTCGTDIVSPACGILVLLAGASAWRMIEQPLLLLKWNGAALIALAFAVVAAVVKTSATMEPDDPS